MPQKKYLTIPELAKIMGLSRIAIYKVTSGKIKSIRIGRNYAIPIKELEFISSKKLNKEAKNLINKAVNKTISEYGEVLKKLGKE
ncbi:helix-turn-helix domain-containing protein [bacterium]